MTSVSSPISLIWGYNRPSYVSAAADQSVTATNANTIYAAGPAIQITSMTGFIHIKFIAGLFTSATGNVTIYIYKSYTGLPAIGSTPPSTDTQIASITIQISSTSTTYNVVLSANDNVPQGQSVFYYIAVSAQTANTGFTFTATTNPLPGILGAVNGGALEAICV